MKIVRLKSSNIMKLTAVEIDPTGSIVTIGGRNGAGKSSVLNSIAMALGGKEMVPDEPIRRGESEASIVVELDDIVVTRKFSRDVEHAAHCDSVIEKGRRCDCVPHFGETRSTLIVASKDGARYPSPQTMLDKLLGRLTFDPLAFAHADQRSQSETLRRLVGLDTTKLDAERAALAASRYLMKKDVARRQVVIDEMPYYLDAPSVGVSAESLIEEGRRVEELNRNAADIKDQVIGADRDARDLHARRSEIAKSIEDAKARLSDLESELRSTDELIVDAKTYLKDREDAYEVARAICIDPATVKERIAEIEKVNRAVAANAERAAAIESLVEYSHELDEIDGKIAAVDDERIRLIESTKFPVDGLGIDDGVVTFGGLPLSQASSAEQLRVSVAIGLAMNPRFRVLLVRNGNLLDKDSMAAMAKMAEEADAQVWMEYVTEDAKTTQVFIEDGHRG